MSTVLVSSRRLMQTSSVQNVPAEKKKNENVEKSRPTTKTSVCCVQARKLRVCMLCVRIYETSRRRIVTTRFHSQSAFCSPVRPMPAEQWTIIGGPRWCPAHLSPRSCNMDDWHFRTLPRKSNMATALCGTPKSGHELKRKWDTCLTSLV